MHVDSAFPISAKLSTAAEAVSRIQPGTRIFIGSGAAEPVRLVQALVEAPQLSGNEVVHLLTLGPAPYVAPAQQERMRHCAYFIGSNVRDAVRDCRADYMPVFLSEIPRLIRGRRSRIDVALIQVSSVDAQGYVSLGVSVDVVRAAVESADLVIAELNPRMPRTHGDSFVHVRDIDVLVSVDAPLLELTPGKLDDVARDIGRNVATLIPDGATLQLGIGRIPDAVLSALTERHDLGIHTEMFSDGVMRLVNEGVITGKAKTLLPGKLVTSFLMGSADLYKWADGNPAIEMRPSDFTNDPFTIARNDRMVAVNSALAVDLTGQVAADTLDGCFFSGIGGQVDFIRGASRSNGGRPIIALPSRAKGGSVSRICAALESGAGVVTSRGDVHYVVTEYGVADLWGKSIRERALALISIAHPDHRAELTAAAKSRKFILPAEQVPRTTPPWLEEERLTLPTTEKIRVRPLRISDTRAVKELLYRTSEESLYQRFLAHRSEHPDAEIRDLVDLADEATVALVVTPEDSEEVIALARYDVNSATRRADLALLVRDDWQHRGIGSRLMKRMRQIAFARGLNGFELDILSTNRPMLQLLARSGLKYRGRCEAGVHHFLADFD